MVMCSLFSVIIFFFEKNVQIITKKNIMTLKSGFGIFVLFFGYLNFSAVDKHGIE